MLAWLGRRLGHRSGGGANRADRRALSRLSRPPRRVLRQQARRLSLLPAEHRDYALSLLPEWQAQALRDELRRKERR